MKLKNIGNKIISIGATVILPGEAKEVTGYDEDVYKRQVSRHSSEVLRGH